jgi:hypothetical protein
MHAAIKNAVKERDIKVIAADRSTGDGVDYSGGGEPSNAVTLELPWQAVRRLMLPRQLGGALFTWKSGLASSS